MNDIYQNQEHQMESYIRDTLTMKQMLTDIKHR